MQANENRKTWSAKILQPWTNTGATNPQNPNRILPAELDYCAQQQTNATSF